MSLPIRFFFRSATVITKQQTTLLRPTSINSFIQSTRGFSSTIANMGVHNISSKGDLAEVLSKSKADGKIVVLDAFATWCGPCKVIAPTVATWAEESLDETNKDKGKFRHVTFLKVDVDEVPDVAQEHDVRAMPTFLLFKDGEYVDRVVGANPTALSKRIEQLAGLAPEA